MAVDPNDVKRQIQEEINKLVGEEKRLYQEQYDLLERNNSSVESFQRLLRDVKNIIRELNSDLNYTSQIFQNILRELQGGNKALQFQETLVSRANTVARQTLEIRKGETFADASKIQSLQRENQLNLSQLTSLRDSGKLQGDQLTLINKQIEGLELVDQNLKDISDRNKEINKGFSGAIPALAKMFSSTGVIGNSLTQAYQTTVQLGQGAMAAGVNFNTMSTFTQALGSNLKSALGPIALLILAVEQLKEALVVADKSTGNLAKDFNLTYDAAASLRQELIQIGDLSMDAALTSGKLQESVVAVGKALGSNAVLNQQDLEFMTKLREQAGFTNEEIIGIEKTTLATGRNLKDNVKNLMMSAKTTALNNGVLLNEKDIMRDVANTSDAIKLSLKGSGGALGAAAAQAKALGMSLAQVDNIAKSLLDFESSISAELEAELLTGKELNLEQARLYAINNDIEGLSREIAKNYGSAAEFGQMNRLQQEAAAKAVGMTREELAATLTDAEALRELSGEEAKNAQAALNAARARGMTEEQIANTTIENLMKQQSVQDRFNQAVEKLKEIFIAIAEPVLKIVSPFVDLVTTILPAFNLLLSPLIEGFNLISQAVSAFVNGLKEGNPLALTLAGILAAMSISSIVSAVSWIWTTLSQIPFGVGLPLAAIATAGLISLIGKAKSSAATPMAEGGIVKPTAGGTNTVIGEAGRPEAVIPLGTPEADKYLGKNEKLNTGITGPTKGNESEKDKKVYEKELYDIISILREIEFATKTSSATSMAAFGARAASRGLFGTDFDNFGTSVNVNSRKVQ